MMKNIVVITGSSRPNSVNQIVVAEIVNHLSAYDDVSVQVADLADLNMPYMDSLYAPSHKDFTIDNSSVKIWSEMVAGSDGVVFVTPEYNHSISGILKNAIDWLYREWADKPSAFVGYGAYAAKNSYRAFLQINEGIKTKLGPSIAAIQLGEVIAYDGTILDRQKFNLLLSDTLDELVKCTD